MAYNVEPVSSDGEPLYFEDIHNIWFEQEYLLLSGTVADAYRQHLAVSAAFILSDLLPTTLRRSNAKKEKHPNAGQFGTAGISGVSKKRRVRAKHPATFGTAGVSGVHRQPAVREKHPNAGKFGTAGVSGVQRSNAVQRDGARVGKSKQSRQTNELIIEGALGSYRDSEGSRRSSRVARTSPTTSPRFDQFENPPM